MVTPNERSSANPSSCQTVLSIRFAQQLAAQWKRMLPWSPPMTFRSSTPAPWVKVSPKVESCAVCEAR